MKQKRATVLSLICGIVCACCVVAYTQMIQGNAEAQRAEAMERYGGDQIEVCVATRDIAPGEAISSSNMETRLWLADLLPEQALQPSSQVTGRRTTSSIVSGEVLCEQRFTEVASSVQVPAGLCALSIPLSPSKMVGGALSQGSRVDIYASGATTTKLLAHDVQVLVVPDSIGSSSAANTWITVAVQPEKTEEFIAVMQKEDLYITLPSQTEGEDHA